MRSFYVLFIGRVCWEVMIRHDYIGVHWELHSGGILFGTGPGNGALARFGIIPRVRFERLVCCIKRGICGGLFGWTVTR